MNNQKLYMETATHRLLTQVIIDQMIPDEPVPMMLLWSGPGMGKTTWIREHLVRFFDLQMVINFHNDVTAANLWNYMEISYNDRNQQKLDACESDALALLTGPAAEKKLLVLEEIHKSPGALYALNGLGNRVAEITITEGNLGTRRVTNAAVVMTSNQNPVQFLDEEFIDRCDVINIHEEGFSFFTTPEAVLDILPLSAGLKYYAPVIMDAVSPNLRPGAGVNPRQWKKLFTYIESFTLQGYSILEAVRIAFTIHLGKGTLLLPGVSPQSVSEAFKALYEERLMDL